ncbi:MAG TPA: alpha/beta hydrolase [Polyangiaceae bacterium]
MSSSDSHATAARPTVLVAPGFGDSGPDHWQTIWQKRHGYIRVEQSDWNRPERAAWVECLARAVRAAAPGPVVIVAHSLACAMVAHFAGANPTSPVAGALLVAPADVDSEMHTPDEVRNFAPLPLERLPFPSIVVASRTDPYVRFKRAEEIASMWGARFVDAGRAGHINPDSGFGEWPEGYRLLEELLTDAVGANVGAPR